MSSQVKSPPEVEESVPRASLSSALKGFVNQLHKQAARHTDLIDVFAHALKEINREVKTERGRRELLEKQLAKAEDRIEQLEETVRAIARQGWVH